MAGIGSRGPARTLVASAAAAATGYAAGVGLSLVPSVLRLILRELRATAAELARLPGSRKQMAAIARLVAAIVKGFGLLLKGALRGNKPGFAIAIVMGGSRILEAILWALARRQGYTKKIVMRESSPRRTSSDGAFGTPISDGSSQPSKPDAIIMNPQYASLCQKIAFASFSITALVAAPLIPARARAEFGLTALVTAVDVAVGWLGIGKRLESSVRSMGLPEWVVTNLDTASFTFCSVSIVFSWFYIPDAIPHGLSSFITHLSHISPLFIQALRNLQAGTMRYGHSDPEQLFLIPLARELGFPEEWADPAKVDMLPCVLVHGGSWGCGENAARRAFAAGRTAFKLYLPLNLLSSVVRVVFRSKSAPTSLWTIALSAIIASARSGVFLAAIVALVWAPVCSLRSHILPPGKADAEVWGPLLGSALASLAFPIEHPRRRHELLLFSLPRAFAATWFIFTSSQFSPVIFSRVPKSSLRMVEATFEAVSLSIGVGALAAAWRVGGSRGRLTGWRRAAVKWVVGDREGTGYTSTVEDTDTL
ncbi:hypothetical protein M427DRAFT_388071 [Gonapodya prolifera JEL478]|uniref:Transmembrane protein 135 N-terminal domain-containing protein n=1 Tax=Gonapodya prolifera (strain JEL478) TaxID=1344416 RepID=A0A139A8C1_GONPJ|nr:hypothetical protein M427DRAFT_388071 [Gonapodya prolifera JEL478]|eukprot:KXS12977.1 hypothetical protein M427DRAFT_388071 [Gonapodya prolifera JEL478]